MRVSPPGAGVADLQEEGIALASGSPFADHARDPLRLGACAGVGAFLRTSAHIRDLCRFLTYYERLYNNRSVRAQQEFVYSPAVALGRVLA